MIPVTWYEGIVGVDKYSAQFAHEGIQGRSRYACTGILNDAFDSYGELFQHYSGWDGLPAGTDGAVVIIHGGHLRHDLVNINYNLAKLKWALCIGIGDEEADFNYEGLRHPNMRLWQQSPIPGKSKADRFPIVGYPCDIHEHLVPNQERTLDWFFSGQITHATREECAVQLRRLGGGKLVETKIFYTGLPHDEYFKTLGRAKVVPCPSGPVCADTFRMAEALEAGAIPVCDEKPGWKPGHPKGIFKMLFPQGHPFPVLENWNEFPRVLADILNDYDNKSREVSEFWKKYKRDYYSWLGEDLKALGAM